MRENCHHILNIFEQTLADLMMLIYGRDCFTCYGFHHQPETQMTPTVVYCRTRLRSSKRNKFNQENQFSPISASEEFVYEIYDGKEHEEIELNLFDYHLPLHRLTATPKTATAATNFDRQQLRYRATVTRQLKDVATDTNSLIKYDLDTQNGCLSQRLSITEVTTTREQIDDQVVLTESTELFEDDELLEAREMVDGGADAIVVSDDLQKDKLDLKRNKDKKPPSNGNKKRVFRLSRLNLARRFLPFSSSSSSSYRPTQTSSQCVVCSKSPSAKQISFLLDRRKKIDNICCQLHQTQTKIVSANNTITYSRDENEQQQNFMVMISYHHAEASEYAIKLTEALQELGLSVYLDVHEIRKGSDWQDSLNEAILSCGAFIPLVTPSYGETLWTSRELKLADVLGKLIIPVNFGQHWPPPSLAIQFATMQYIFWLPTPDHLSTSRSSTNLSTAAAAPPLLLRPFQKNDLNQSWPNWPTDCTRIVAQQIKQTLDYCSMKSSRKRRNPMRYHRLLPSKNRNYNELQHQHCGPIFSIEHEQEQEQRQPLSDSSGYYSSSLDDKILSCNSMNDDDDSSSSFEELESLEEENDDDDSSLYSPSSRSIGTSSCPNSDSSEDRLKLFRVSAAATATATTMNCQISKKKNILSTTNLIVLAEPQLAQEKKGLKNRAAKVFKKVRRRFAFTSNSTVVANKQQQHSI